MIVTVYAYFLPQGNLPVHFSSIFYCCHTFQQKTKLFVDEGDLFIKSFEYVISISSMYYKDQNETAALLATNYIWHKNISKENKKLRDFKDNIGLTKPQITLQPEPNTNGIVKSIVSYRFHNAQLNKQTISSVNFKTFGKAILRSEFTHESFPSGLFRFVNLPFSSNPDSISKWQYLTSHSINIPTTKKNELLNIVISRFHVNQIYENLKDVTTLLQREFSDIQCCEKLDIKLVPEKSLWFCVRQAIYQAPNKPKYLKELLTKYLEALHAIKSKPGKYSNLKLAFSNLNNIIETCSPLLQKLKILSAMKGDCFLKRNKMRQIGDGLHVSDEISHDIYLSLFILFSKNPRLTQFYPFSLSKKEAIRNYEEYLKTINTDVFQILSKTPFYSQFEFSNEGIFLFFLPFSSIFYLLHCVNLH